MTLKKIHLENFTVFDKMDIEFSDGVNVFIGENNPKGFNPSSPKKIDNIARKFYDSLHYLSLETKNKPLRYVYIVEYPNAGVTGQKNAS